MLIEFYQQCVHLHLLSLKDDLCCSYIHRSADISSSSTTFQFFTILNLFYICLVEICRKQSTNRGKGQYTETAISSRQYNHISPRRSAGCSQNMTFTFTVGQGHNGCAKQATLTSVRSEFTSRHCGAGAKPQLRACDKM